MSSIRPLPPARPASPAAERGAGGSVTFTLTARASVQAAPAVCSVERGASQAALPLAPRAITLTF